MQKSRSPAVPTKPLPRVVALPLPESDAVLVAALCAGRLEAKRVLFDRYGSDVERVLYRILGPDPEIADFLQDVFLAALASIDKLRNPDALRAWLTGIAVRKARKCILKRQRWRFIHLMQQGEAPDREAPAAPAEVSEALRCTYKVLDAMPPDERLAFALRHIDGMELTRGRGCMRDLARDREAQIGARTGELRRAGDAPPGLARLGAGAPRADRSQSERPRLRSPGAGARRRAGSPARRWPRPRAGASRVLGGNRAATHPTGAPARGARWRWGSRPPR